MNKTYVHIHKYICVYIYKFLISCLALCVKTIIKGTGKTVQDDNNRIVCCFCLMIHVALKTPFLISLLFRLGYLYKMTHTFFFITMHQNNFQDILGEKMAQNTERKVLRNDLHAKATCDLWHEEWSYEYTFSKV